MMSLEEFQSLEVGDQIEIGSLFDNLDGEPVVLTLTGTYGNRRSFLATLYGVSLRTVGAVVTGEKIRWM